MKWTSNCNSIISWHTRQNRTSVWLEMIFQIIQSFWKSNGIKSPVNFHLTRIRNSWAVTVQITRDFWIEVFVEFVSHRISWGKNFVAFCGSYRLVRESETYSVDMEVQDSSLPGFYCSRILGLAPFRIRRNSKKHIEEIQLSSWLCFYSVCFLTTMGKLVLK